MINELLATAYLVPHLKSEKDVYSLNKGSPAMNGTLTVVAPGTGLGEAFLVGDPVLKNGMFMQAFVRKGRLSNLLSRIPVHVILNQRAALLGTAKYNIAMKKTDENS